MRTLAMAALALAACTPKDGPASEAAGPATAGTCDAAKVQDLIGRPAAEASATAQTRSGSKTVRTYVTGSPVTMDYRPDRLNIETNAGGAIVKLSCG